MDTDKDVEEKKPTPKQDINCYKQAKQVQDKCIAIIEKRMAAMAKLQETTCTDVKTVIKLVKETEERNYDSMMRCMESFQQEYQGTTDTMYEQLDLMKARMDKKEAEEAKEKAACGSPARKIPRPAAPTKTSTVTKLTKLTSSKLYYKSLKTAWATQEAATEEELSDFEDFDEHQAPYLVPFQGYGDDSEVDVAGEE